MSIRKAFERLGLEEPQDIKLRHREGIVNECKVSLYLWEVAKPFGPIKKYQMVASVEQEGFPKSEGSHNSLFFDKLEEAEERFNLMVLQYGLKDEEPELERVP